VPPGGLPPAPPGVRVLSEFVVGDEKEPVDVFIYESGGILSGVEVVGFSDKPAGLPNTADLRPFPHAA
jgi:hypothetical protein